LAPTAEKLIMKKQCTLKTVDDFSISGIHTTSDRAKSVVLWLHGIAVDKDEYLGFFKQGAEHLERKGIDSLRIDFRGHGESSGTSLDFSIAGQMLDLEAAIGYLLCYYERAKLKIHVVACSFGAPPAIFMAVRRKVFRKLVLIAPVISYKRTFLKPETEWAKEIFNTRTLLKAQKTNQLFINRDFPISMRLIEEMALIRPEIALREIRVPTILIHGDADSMVPFKVSKAASKGVRSVKLKRFHHMDHGFNDVDDEKGTSERSLKNKHRMFKIIEHHVL
jgi:pimeloyl-ACP methyl ester carboxylesterase